MSLDPGDNAVIVPAELACFRFVDSHTLPPLLSPAAENASHSHGCLCCRNQSLLVVIWISATCLIPAVVANGYVDSGTPHPLSLLWTS
jgi:hypothetical protein